MAQAVAVATFIAALPRPCKFAYFVQFKFLRSNKLLL
jgi:hypothetical protein